MKRVEHVAHQPIGRSTAAGQSQSAYLRGGHWAGVTALEITACANRESDKYSKCAKSEIGSSLGSSSGCAKVSLSAQAWLRSLWADGSLWSLYLQELGCPRQKPTHGARFPYRRHFRPTHVYDTMTGSVGETGEGDCPSFSRCLWTGWENRHTFLAAIIRLR